MTLFEWVIISMIIINAVATAVAPIWYANRESVKNEKVKSIIDTAVKAAEELEVSGQLNTSKQDYVWKIVEEAFPRFAKHRKEIEMLINASVFEAGLGASAKKIIKKK